MTGILNGLRIVEHGAFIAGPYSTMSLARMGAEVIRIDPIRGGIDNSRWPVTDRGRSLYWAGFNKGKKSVRLNLKDPEGQRIAQRIATAAGKNAGIFVSNLTPKGWMTYEALRALRPDLIMVSVVGSRDGATAIDYTVNSAVGFPTATGFPGEDRPVNHVLPAWDLICGLTAATSLLAAERHRRLTGQGQLLSLALADVALSVVADLGLVAEWQLNRTERTRLGNAIYGAFGSDFETADGRRVMVAAVSEGQWIALCNATGIAEDVRAYEAAHGVSLMSDTERFRAHDWIFAAMAPWFRQRSLAQVREALVQHRCCWGPYQSFSQLVAEDPRCSAQNPLFETVDHPGIGKTLTARAPVEFSDTGTAACVTPLLGEHTDEVLHDLLGMGEGEIASLHDRRVIAGTGSA